MDDGGVVGQVEVQVALGGRSWWARATFRTYPGLDGIAVTTQVDAGGGQFLLTLRTVQIPREAMAERM